MFFLVFVCICDHGSCGFEIPDKCLVFLGCNSASARTQVIGDEGAGCEHWARLSKTWELAV